MDRCRIEVEHQNTAMKVKSYKKCPQCVTEQYTQLLKQSKPHEEAALVALDNVKHGVYNRNCQYYTQEVKIMKKRYNF